ncbi:MAG: hypothetical protein IJ744_03175 [Lachnospiraceae bacterium]|nr:hypothetical protein [Lachnospiraceae bacterium]
MEERLNQLGQVVRHKTLGEGKIISMSDASHITVAFAVKTSTFQYPEAFEKYLVFDDGEYQDAALTELQTKRAVSEAEKAAKMQEHQEAFSYATMESKNAVEKKYTPVKRTEGRPLTFFVFQAGYFEDQAQGGFIWAPYFSAAGLSLFYWDSLTNVREGDIIFHGSEGLIKGISRAKGSCYDRDNPYHEEISVQYPKGRAVNCEYTLLMNPIRTADFRDEIIKSCQVKYAPFNKNGDGNQGYLYDLDAKLASVFLKGIVEKNEEVAELEYVRWLM